MKKSQLFFFLLFLCFQSFSQLSLTVPLNDTITPDEGRYLRSLYDINATKDPSLNYVPRFRIIAANIQRASILSNQNPINALLNPLVWTERGPAGDVVANYNGNRRGTSPTESTSGRIRAVWLDLSDVNRRKFWTGGVAGGLWKTDNIDSAPANWVHVDGLGSMPIADICQDPTNHNILYVGTGEYTDNVDAVRGGGIWRSQNGGNTWELMPNTVNYWDVSKMACDNAGNLYVGVVGSSQGGMLRYNKGSNTWTNITPSGLINRVSEVHISSTGRLHIICGYRSASNTANYRYTDTPASVTSGTWNGPVTAPFLCNTNVNIKSNGNTLYALPANGGVVPTFFKSIDGGVTWNAISTPSSNVWGQQSWYCMALAVDPNNANNAIIGNLNVMRTTDGGNSWSKITDWASSTIQYVHADQQAMIWTTNNRVIVASDGGINISFNGGLTWSDRNNGLRIKQFYSVGVHPTAGSNYLIGGAQDNGSHQINSASLGTSVEVLGGDGAFAHIDQKDPNYQFVCTQFINIHRSTNGGVSFSGAAGVQSGDFINPSDYDDFSNTISEHKMYFKLSNGSYMVWENPASNAAPIGTQKNTGVGNITHIKVSPFEANVIYLGTNAGRIYKITNANTTPAETLISTGITNGIFCSSVEFGTTDQNIIATFSNYGINNVWVTTNGGSSWTAIDGNLPDMPVRWALFTPGNNTEAIIATESGIWETSNINGSSTVWVPNASFPNTRVDMLQLRTSDNLVAAATHGRGFWTAFFNAAPSTCAAPLNLSVSNINNNSVVVNWSAVNNINNYVLEYKENSAVTWNSVTIFPNQLPYTISGLTGNTTYNWRVRSNCISTGTSSFTNGNNFTTLPNPPPAPCNTPTGLTATSITINSVILNWSNVSGAVSYIIEYKLSTNPTYTSITISAGQKPYTLSGLIPNRTYNWRITAVCTIQSVAAVGTDFTTLDDTPLPTCTPPSSLSVSNIEQTRASLSWSPSATAISYSLEYKLSSSPTWIVINNVTSTYILQSLTPGSTYNWRLRSRCNTVTHATEYSLYVNGGNIVTLAVPITCTAVFTPTVVLSSESANISWNSIPNAISYTTEYKLTSSGTWTNSLTSASTSRVISGLLPGTSYDWRIRANCTLSLSSDWSEFDFETEESPLSCVSPTNLSVSSITQTSANLSWTAVPNILHYKLEYKVSSSPTWIVIDNIYTNTYNLTGLSPSTTYNWKLTIICSSVLSSSTVNGTDFTTLTNSQTCNAPSGLNVLSITATSASLIWNAVQGALNYTVEYKLASSPTWGNSIVVSSTTRVLGGLVSNSLYDWRVRANCSGSQSSNFVTGSFTTLVVIPPCNTPGGLTVTSQTISSAAVSWNPVLTSIGYRIEYKKSNVAAWTVAEESWVSTTYTFNALEPSTTYNWRIKAICSISPASSSSYASSSFTTTSTPTCQSIYDTDTNNSPQTSSVILISTDIKGSINVANDRDFYKVVITSTATYNFTLSDLPANYDMFLYAPNRITQLKKSVRSGSTTETFSHRLSSGIYYILVKPRTATLFNNSVCYNLRYE